MIAALLYVAGALLVLGGAFMPISARVHATRDAASKAAAADAAPTAWRWHHVLLASGAVVTVAAALWEAIGSGQTALVAAAAALTLGAVLFVHFLVARVATPPATWFTGQVGRRRYMGFVALSVAGLVLRGVAATQAGEAAGTVLMAYGLLLFGVLVWRQDVPPFAPYVGTLAWGFTLLP